MSDLREKLATQLLMALVEGRTQVERPDTDPDNVGGTAINVVEAWNYVAEECIRQMEWARRHCCPVAKYESIEIDKNKYPGISGVRVVGTNPLTAAPADWNPTPTKEEPK